VLVTIHFKKQQDPQQFHLDHSELRKLVDDFENYTKQGQPKRGLYNGYNDLEKSSSQTFLVDFDAISLII
jgi:hypothetical protein